MKGEIMPMRKLLHAAALVSGAVIAAGSASAASLSARSAAETSLPRASVIPAVAGGNYASGLPESGVTLVRRHYHRHHGHHHRHRYRHHGHYYYYDDDDYNPGAFIALGVIGALIANGLSEDAASSRIAQCEAHYRSFEPDTGLYTTYGGEKVLCPYLR
jgi:hypothetical protein